jgi:hypothetical protein
MADGGGDLRSQLEKVRASRRYAFSQMYHWRDVAIAARQRAGALIVINEIQTPQSARIPIHLQVLGLNELMKTGDETCPVCFLTLSESKIVSGNTYSGSSCVCCTQCGGFTCGECVHAMVRKECPTCRRPYPDWLTFAPVPLQDTRINLHRFITDGDSPPLRAAMSSLLELDQEKVDTWTEFCDRQGIPGLAFSAPAYTLWTAKNPSHTTPAAAMPAQLTARVETQEDLAKRREFLVKVYTERLAAVKKVKMEGGAEEEDAADQKEDATTRRSMYPGQCGKGEHKYEKNSMISRFKLPNHVFLRERDRSKITERYWCASCMDEAAHEAMKQKLAALLPIK